MFGRLALPASPGHWVCPALFSGLCPLSPAHTFLAVFLKLCYFSWPGGLVLCVFVFFNYWNIFQYYFEKKGPEQRTFMATCHRLRDPLFRLGRPLRLSGFHFLLMLKVLISLYPFVVI